MLYLKDRIEMRVFKGNLNSAHNCSKAIERRADAPK